MRSLKVSIRGLGAFVLASTSVLFFNVSAAHAIPSTAATDQAACTTGSGTPKWSDYPSVSRPVVASLVVDGETVSSPEVPAAVGKIGIAICPQGVNGRKTGVQIIRKSGTSPDSFSQDLTGATTPSGAPITTNSIITVTINNFGSLGQYFTFALVHGVVTNWTTSGLGTSAATLSFSVHPTRTPIVDNAYSQCSATPPDCQAPQSVFDIPTVALQLDLDQAGPFDAFRGSYFAITGAVAGFIQNTRNDDGSPAIAATLGGPHLLADGSTLNTGGMTAFLPTNVVATIFGLSPTDAAAQLGVTRTATGDTSTPTFSIAEVSGGITVSVPSVGFSSPVYKIAKAAAVAATPASSSARPAAVRGAIAATGHRFEQAILFALMLIGFGLIVVRFTGDPAAQRD